MRRLRALVVAVVLVGGVACAKHVPPASLSGPGVVAWYANETAVILGEVQHIAIALNGVERCDAATPPVCGPVLSAKNTGVVVDAVTDALITIRAAPTSWRTVADTALDRVVQRLDAAGKTKLASYVDAARAALAAVTAQ